MQEFALLSIVFSMAFVMVFDRIHWRHKHSWAANLMSREDLALIMRILEASNEA
jgi:hypothetical protein